MKLALGKIVVTPGALEALARDNKDPSDVILRHRKGDWGDVAEENNQANNKAVTTDDVVLSSYPLRGTEKVWVITEGDRSVTSILLPEER